MLRRQRSFSPSRAWDVALVVGGLALQVSSQDLDFQPPEKVAIPGVDSRLTRLIDHVGPLSERDVPVGVETTDDGRVVVVIDPEGGDTSAIDPASLEALGVKILATSSRLLRVSVPPAVLADVAALSGVRFVRPPIRPSELAVTSEGAGVLNVDLAHTNSVLGEGVKVAVIDVGFALADFAAFLGEIPLTAYLKDYTGQGIFTGSSSHGTAVAEIVHDVAPLAEIHLIKVGDLLDLWLAELYCEVNDIDIVSHSLGWYGTGIGDGQGIACDIVNSATAGGILWVNAAGNAADGHQYTGTFTDPDGDGWHEFSGGDETINLGRLSFGDQVQVWMTWNDWPDSWNDYELYLYRSNSDGSLQLLDSSLNWQLGTDPTEFVSWFVSVDAEYHMGAALSRRLRSLDGAGSYGHRWRRIGA